MLQNLQESEIYLFLTASGWINLQDTVSAETHAQIFQDHGNFCNSFLELQAGHRRNNWVLCYNKDYLHRTEAGEKGGVKIKEDPASETLLDLESFNGMLHLSENGKPRGQFDAIIISRIGDTVLLPLLPLSAESTIPKLFLKLHVAFIQFVKPGTKFHVDTSCGI
ncbi:hypothetical protein WN943_025762 [Citrus x changshan-huyou]